MKDYRELSDFEKAKVLKQISEEIEPGPRKNEYSGFEWIEPDYTINRIKSGDYCAECYNIYYNCLCSHY